MVNKLGQKSERVSENSHVYPLTTLAGASTRRHEDMRRFIFPLVASHLVS
jgi:hypothetical protein